MGTLTINNAACNVVIYHPEYGLLYNWYSASGDANGDGMAETSLSSSSDWILPAASDCQALLEYLGATVTFDGSNYTVTDGISANAALKETGNTYWSSGNNGTNTSGFNGRGAGQRTNTEFTNINAVMQVRTSTPRTTQHFTIVIQGGSVSSTMVPTPKYSGLTVRFLYTGAGTPTSYTGNDGKVYRVVTIGTQTWLADNLSETRFRNGDIIPWHGATPASYFTNAEWAALTTSGVCAYNNDVNNVAPGFSFPT